MRKMAFSIISTLLLFVSVNVFAADPKIGILDINKVLASTPQVAALKTKLKNQFTPKIKEVSALDKTLKTDIAKFSKDNAVMKANERSALQAKIQSEQAQLRKMQASFQQEFMDAQNQAQQTVMKQLEDAAAKVALAQGYDLVLVKDTVAFNVPTFDVTQPVIDILKK